MEDVGQNVQSNSKVGGINIGELLFNRITLNNDNVLNI